MRRYYIDFKTWEINADSEEEAEGIALGKIASGNVPMIDRVEDTDEEEPLEEDVFESINIKDMK